MSFGRRAFRSAVVDGAKWKRHHRRKQNKSYTRYILVRFFSLSSISSHLLLAAPRKLAKNKTRTPVLSHDVHTLSGPFSRVFSPFKSSFSVGYLRSHRLLYTLSYLFVVIRLSSTRPNVVSSLVFPAKPPKLITYSFLILYNLITLRTTIAVLVSATFIFISSFLFNAPNTRYCTELLA